MKWKVQKPIGDTNEIQCNIIYLAATRRVIWQLLEEKSYLAATRREVILRPSESLSGGGQKSYLAAARREELSGGRQ